MRLTSSNNMTVGPRNKIMVRRRGRTAAHNSPTHNRIIYYTNNQQPKSLPPVFRPRISDKEYFSKSCGLPNMYTNTGDMRVMKPAETNLLLIVSG